MCVALLAVFGWSTWVPRFLSCSSEAVTTTPDRSQITKTDCVWTPADKPVRKELRIGNNTGKAFECKSICKCCGEAKCPSFPGAKQHHGATCGYCRCRMVYHGRKHLKLSGAGRLEDFSQEQREAIKEESLKARREAKEKSEELPVPKKKKRRTASWNWKLWKQWGCSVAT